MIFLLIPIIAISVLLGLVYLSKSIIHPSLIVILIPLASYTGYLFQLSTTTAIPLNLFQIFLILGFFIFVFHKLIRQEPTIKVIGIEIEFLLFFILISLSLIYSPNRGLGLFYMLRLLVLIFMIYLFVNTIENPYEIRLIFYSLVGISLILGLISIKEAILNPQAVLLSYMSVGKQLVRGTTFITEDDPNKFAALFFLPISFSVSMVMVRGQILINRIIWVFISSILILSIISTFSRSGWVSIIFALLILTLLFKQYKIILVLIVGMFSVMIFIPMVQIVFINVVQRFVDIFAGSSDVSANIRILLAKGAIEMFFDSYMIGVGFMGFPAVLPKYVSTQKTFGITEPHNILYTVLAELGLVAFLLFLWIIWKVFYTANYNFKQSTTSFEKIIAVTLLTTFISQLTFFQFYVDGLLDNNLWMTVALIFSFNSYLNSKNSPIPTFTA